MATHSSVLAWRIPWTEEPGGLQPMGSQRVRHDWSNLAHTQTWTFCSVQLLGRVYLFVAPWTPARQASLFFTITRSLLKFMSLESLMLSNHLILCHPLLLLPSIFPSIRVFSCQVAKVLELQLQHQSFHEYSEWISFKTDWFGLLAAQGTLKSLLKGKTKNIYIYSRYTFRVAHSFGMV